MNIKTWGGFLMAMAMMLNLPMTAGATSTTIGANTSSPQDIMIQRQVIGVTNPVTNVFQYQITAAETNPSAVSGLPSLMSINMNAVEPSENVAVGFGWLNFSNVEFDTLGDYKFIVRETSSSNPSIYPVDTEHEYYIYVYVRNEIIDGTLTGNYVANLVLQAKDGDQGEKRDIVFASVAQFTYIEIKKNVTGNIAHTDEYFKFELSFDGVNAGDRYVIAGQDASVIYNGETIATSNEYVVGGENAIYLKHGQTVTVGVNGDLYQLPIGARYSIGEVSNGDYVVYANDEQRTSIGLREMEPLLNGELTAANKTIFINHKESEVLTGVTMAIIPFGILAVLGVSGYVITRKLRKAE